MEEWIAGKVADHTAIAYVRSLSNGPCFETGLKTLLVIASSGGFRRCTNPISFAPEEGRQFFGNVGGLKN